MLAVLYNNLQIISLAFYAIILLIAGWLFYAKKISVQLVLKFILAIIIFLLVHAVFYSFLQYYAFKAGSPGVYLLPPYQPITYFISYVGLHFWAAPIFAIAASFLFGFAAWILNYVGRERFFEKEELFLLALGGLTSGWPNFLTYLGLTLALMILVNAVNLAVYRNAEYRLPSGAFIIASALLVLFFGDYLAPYVGITQFRI